MLPGKTNVARVKKIFLKITLDKSHFITGIKDETKKKMFLNGEGDVLVELFENVPAL